MGIGFEYKHFDLFREAKLKEIEAQFQGEEEELEFAIQEAEKEEEKYLKMQEQRKQMRSGAEGHE